VRLRAIAHARRRAVRAPRSLRYGAIAIAVLVHFGAAMFLYVLMLPHPSVDRDRIEVRLLEAPSAIPVLPEPPPKPESATSPAAAPVAPPRALPTASATTAPNTIATQAASPDALVTTAHLFNPDGSVRLASEAKPSVHEEGMERARELMARGHNPLHCARGMLFPESGLSINEQAAKAARKTRLMAFATQGPGVIQAQYDSQTNVAAEHTSDSTIDRLKLEEQACDDEFYRRPPPPKPEERH